MSSQAFRSAYSQARPELERMRLPLQNYFRHFSTTQPQRADSDKDAGTKQSVRERAVFAANQMNFLVQKRVNPVEMRDYHHHQQQQQPPTEAADRPRVIDVRSLPRGLGRGGLRGRGGIVGSTPGAARAISPRGNRFSPGNRAAPSRGGMTGAGRFSGRGGRGGRGGGRGGGGARTGKPKAKEDGEKAAPLGPRGKNQDPFEKMDPAVKAFDDAMRFGTRTEYTPDLTLESLAAFYPAVPTSVEGQRAAIMQNLSVLGTADPIGVPQNFQPRNYAEEVEQNGIRFFADIKAKEAAEQYLQEKRQQQQQQQQQQDGVESATESATDLGPIIQGAEEAIQKVILDRAVVGIYEEPKFAKAEDVVGLARSWHLRAETYTSQDVESFEKKLASVLAMATRTQGQPRPKT